MSLSEDSGKEKSIAITHELETTLFRKGQHFSNSIFSQRNKVEIINLQGENHQLTMSRHFLLNQYNKLTRITKIYNKNQLATITDTIQAFERPRDSFISPHRFFEECQQPSNEDPCIKNIVNLFKTWLLESHLSQRAYMQLQEILQGKEYTYQLVQTIFKNQMLRQAFLEFQTGGKKAIGRAKLQNKREHNKTLKNCLQLIKMEEIINKPEEKKKIDEKTKQVKLTLRGVERTFKSQQTENNTQE